MAEIRQSNPTEKPKNLQITRDFFNAYSEKAAALDAYDAMDKLHIERYTLEVKHLEEVTLRGFNKTHNLPCIEQRKMATRTTATFPEAQAESTASSTGDKTSSRVLDSDSSFEDY